MKGFRRKSEGKSPKEHSDAEQSRDKYAQEDDVPSDAVIYCDSLVKIYRSNGFKVMALQGLELEVKRGEMMAIIGKSGSGKSTLLNIIGGVETPSAGRLLVDGRDFSLLKEKEMGQSVKDRENKNTGNADKTGIFGERSKSLCQSKSQHFMKGSHEMMKCRARVTALRTKKNTLRISQERTASGISATLRICKTAF